MPPDRSLTCDYGNFLSRGRVWRYRSVAKPTVCRSWIADRSHRAAICSAEARSRGLADIQAAPGLEQQLIHALVECLLPGSADEETPAARRHRNVVARFEELLQAGSSHHMSEICAALGVSDRLLRECCKAHLGMSPSGYRRRLRMGQVRRELGGGNPQTTTVSEVAGRHGFRDLGRFAGHYRAIYGESPSATRQRQLSRQFHLPKLNSGLTSR
jgi:AraC-like DNA-binding protein